MNENKEQFGLDNIQPLDSVAPASESNMFEMPSFYNEPKVEEKTHTMQEVPPTVAPEPFMDPTVSDNLYNFGPEMPAVNSIQEPIKEVESTSYAEMPTVDRPVGEMSEHPDAIVSLHREAEEAIIPNLPEEKVDKGTIFLLVALFIGMLAVIIVLPYLL